MMLGQHSRPYMIPFSDFEGRVSGDVIEASEDPEYLRSLLREDEDQLVVEPISVPQVAR